MRAAGLVLCLVLLAAARPLVAQSPHPVLELRADVLGGPRPSVQGGAGVEIPAGPYVRVGVIAGLGAHTDTPHDGAARLDVLGRFLLDPFRQSRWGLSAGGGVSLRGDAGARIRPSLLVAVDLEGPRWPLGFSPALQVGLGGGFRAGVVLRASSRPTR